MVLFLWPRCEHCSIIPRTLRDTTLFAWRRLSVSPLALVPAGPRLVTPPWDPLGFGSRPERDAFPVSQSAVRIFTTQSAVRGTHAQGGAGRGGAPRGRGREAEGAAGEALRTTTLLTDVPSAYLVRVQPTRHDVSPAEGWSLCVSSTGMPGARPAPPFFTNRFPLLASRRY